MNYEILYQKSPWRRVLNTPFPIQDILQELKDNIDDIGYEY